MHASKEILQAETREVLEDAETVEFSPTAEYRHHMEAVGRSIASTSQPERR